MAAEGAPGGAEGACAEGAEGAGAGAVAGSGALRPGEALRAALLSNANLGGDCCNRGMLLGAVLGCVVGASGLPPDLVGGLLRRPQLVAAIDAFAERAARQLLGESERQGGGAAAAAAASAAAVAAAPPLEPRFGRPSPLPRRAYTSSSAVRAPRDFEAKLALMREHARAAGVAPHHLRYVRGAAGPFAVVEARGARALAAPASAPPQPLCARLALVAVDLGGGARAAAAAPAATLTEGDAARDRAEVLGGRAAAPVAASAIALSPDQLALIEASMDDAVFAAEGAAEGAGADAGAGVGVGVGVGAFYYAPAAQLAARLAGVAAAREAAAPDAEDVVSAALRRDFGVRFEIAAGWGRDASGAMAQPAAPPCA